jgi:putative membrane protein
MMAALSAWLVAAIPHLKALHIATLALWGAGMFALPVMLARHDPAVSREDYARIRRATHYGYTFVITPAAVLAIASGTLLIFLREVFVLWMFAKLVFVALLVVFHAWVGHTIVRVAETEGAHEPPEPRWPLAALTVPVVAILALVLAKPDLGRIPVPGWLEEPLGIQLPFDVPRR